MRQNILLMVNGAHAVDAEPDCPLLYVHVLRDDLRLKNSLFGLCKSRIFYLTYTSLRSLFMYVHVRYEVNHGTHHATG